ncbi:DinB family protein [Glutamicibacter sp.]|uniref:DinB family protein n=1 Tax=Glutamicibacter sp. TaxID=1931995 RepID=UPI0028BE8983|nr:DinB family protein [Glutamicibacter sp.]
MNINEILSGMAHRPIDAAHNLRPLTVQELNAHPGEHPNSIAWLLWHTGREVDVQLAQLRDEPQLWESYRDRFNLGELGDSVGYGHTSDQARQIVVDDQQLLVEYVDASLNALEDYVATLSVEEFEQVVDRRWEPPVTRAVRLVSIVDDATAHVAQAAYAAGALKN